MRLIALAAAAALGFSTLSAPQSSAQPADTPAVSGDLQVVWEVKNRFRLFRNEADFRKHVAADAGNGVLATERKLAQETDGRGWARDTLAHLCVDGTGKLAEICQRDGEKENYLSPEDHRVGVRIVGPVPQDATCTWTFDDALPPPQQATVPCGQEVRLRVRYGRTTVASVSVTRADGSTDSGSIDIKVEDYLIAGLGDSVAAGEGNPDRPVTLADEGFCFRSYLGTAAAQYYRPSRAGFKGDRACDQSRSEGAYDAGTPSSSAITSTGNGSA